MVPAAVTWPENIPPNSAAASTTARYPATFDSALSTSSDCAREMRGTASSARAVTPRSASSASSSGRAAGDIWAISTAPGRRAAGPGAASDAGARVTATTSAAQASASGTTEAPAAA
nr:hypothetical protein GCM10025730_45960 [Promicromonospora thailandica]